MNKRLILRVLIIVGTLVLIWVLSSALPRALFGTEPEPQEIYKYKVSADYVRNDGYEGRIKLERTSTEEIVFTEEYVLDVIDRNFNTDKVTVSAITITAIERM